MNFTGTWICDVDREKLRLNQIQNTDDYYLEYGEGFNTSEAIQIFRTDDNHALLAASIKFGRRNIITVSEDSFQIGDNIYQRKAKLE